MSIHNNDKLMQYVIIILNTIQYYNNDKNKHKNNRQYNDTKITIAAVRLVPSRVAVTPSFKIIAAYVHVRMIMYMYIKLYMIVLRINDCDLSSKMHPVIEKS